MKIIIGIFMTLISSVVFSQESWDYKQNVIYQENHDPSRVWLKDGRKIEVNYGDIPWKEVNNWTAGKQLILGYKIGVGTLLFDPVTKKQIHVVSGLEKHMIDLMLEECLDKNYSTSGMVSCLNKANESWDKELNANYNRLMSTLSEEQKESLRNSQLAWIKFKEAQLKAISEIYDTREGTIWIVTSAQIVVDITKEQALRLNSFMGF